MPITSQNELPHVKISLCEPGQGKCIGLSLLYDIGAALNTGYLYHQKIMKEYPAIVARYEEFDSEDPFDPIRLCGAITNPKDYDKSKHGILSAVIEYHTAYCHQNGSPFKLTLALGQDMSVNSILGLPSIMACDLQAR